MTVGIRRARSARTVATRLLRTVAVGMFAILAPAACEAGSTVDPEAAQDAAIADNESRFDRATEEHAADLYDDAFDDGQYDGESAGTDDGHEVGYDDAENGESRGTSFDPDPTTSSGFSPADDADDYVEGYEEGFSEAYNSAYEDAYDDGYDEALEFYRDPEIENPYDEDCDDVGSSVYVDEDDPDNLDRDGNGIGCE